MAQSHIKGQSLVEVLVALSIGAVMIGGAATALFVSVRSNATNRQSTAAAQLAQQILDNVRVLAEADWNAIYKSTKYIDADHKNEHYLSIETDINDKKSFKVNSGTEGVTVDGVQYVQSFYVQNVSRDASGGVVDTGGTDDPSTQKIVINITWPVSQSLQIIGYITRSRNFSPVFSSWEAGPGIEGPISITDINKGFSYSSGIDFESEKGVIKIMGY